MGRYIKIYFWQAISLLFNFASVFVVTPFISSNQSLYGIYSIVIAAYLFLSYADFGFLSAGMKYAAESYAKKDLKSEVEVLGFAGIVFLSFVGLYSIVMLGLSFSPDILINSLHQGTEMRVSRSLLTILAIFSPAIVFQRIIQIIYSIRLMDYKFQRILIVSNLLKVLSAFVFFGSGRYLIVEYFLFSQLCTLSAILVGLYKAKKELDYDLRLLFRSFRFTSKIYLKTKNLAFSSIFLTLCWIIYYELDPFVIGRMLGAKEAAVYAIGLTVITYFRSIFGILFTPFIARFNHFIGLNDLEGLGQLVRKVMVIFLPLTVFPVIAIVLTAKTFIHNWVGENYVTSIPIMQMLVLSYIFSFISYPAGILLMAHERVKTLYYTSALQPFIYWSGISATFTFWGLQSFANFKFIAFCIAAIVYAILTLRFLNIRFSTFFAKILLPAILPIILITSLLLIIRGYLPLEHNKVNLIIYFLANGLVILAGIVCYYFTSGSFMQYTNVALSSMWSKVTKLSS